MMQNLIITLRQNIQCDLEKIDQAVSENKKTFTDYKILYMHIAQRKGQKTLGDKSLIATIRVCCFEHTLSVSAISL